jgi:CRISPR-associated endonuclease/helicase Cas3
MSHRFLAHVRKDASGFWQENLLETHLQDVSELAAQFAGSFGVIHAPWAALAGRWHDLGKYNPAFQKYLRTQTGYVEDAHLENLADSRRVDHSTAGARHAMARLASASSNPQGKLAARILAYIIAGHHAGLGNWYGELEQRLRADNFEKEAIYNASLAQGIPDEILSAEPLELPRPKGKSKLWASLWIRMLFSCLVDADFLDTEEFMAPEVSQQRGQYPKLATLKSRFDAYISEKSRQAPPSAVNAIRADILSQCRQKAEEAPGVFSLSVPTGGGKTLSSTAFALDHALKYQKRRIIYVIPYTSIIEQTADVLRQALGAEVVIEHHSNLEPDKDNKETSKVRLASENWDAPVIVTTNVQFFESLFASRTSRVRKIHNIANSVVILDEVQQLPWNYKAPIEQCLQALVDGFDTTVVLSSATQPRLGLTNVREIVDNPEGLQTALKRVEIHLPKHQSLPCTWEALAEELAQQERVLCVVNRRQDCRDLHRQMPEDTWHLSALMCGAHRSRVIGEIKAALKQDNRPVRVISTQLVEAGVDLDFPVVYRALAGLDSIIQAAGRCNREGRLREPGRVMVFRPPKPAPTGFLRWSEDACQELMALIEEGEIPDDPQSLTVIERYFTLLANRTPSEDEKGILPALTPDNALAIRFRDASDNFKLIDDDSGYLPVIVQYCAPGQSLDDWHLQIETLKHVGPSRERMRALQRLTVTLPPRQHQQLRAKGEIEELHPGIFAQVTSRLYCERVGLLASEADLPERDAASLVV